jgi:hypothetical protein
MKCFYSLEDFTFLKSIQAQHAIFLDEFLKNDSSLFVKYYYKNNSKDDIAVFNSSQDNTIPWVSIPIFDNTESLIQKTIKTYPETLSNIQSIISDNFQIYTANFCILNNLSYFPRHKHEKDNFRIFHVLLNELDNYCLYETENEYRTIKKPGDYIIFDLSKMHSVYNFSNSSKLSLSISFKVND